MSKSRIQMKDGLEMSSCLFRSHVQATGIEGALTAAISTPRFLKLVFREGIVARHDSAFFQYLHAPSRGWHDADCHEHLHRACGRSIRLDSVCRTSFSQAKHWPALRCDCWPPLP